MKSYHLKTRLCVVAAALVIGSPQLKADLVGPYTPDANTLFLFHFNEPAGSSATVNAGSKGGNSYTVQNDTAGTGQPNPPAVTDLLGAAGYSSGPINFGNSANFHTAGYLIGYDFNANGAYEADVQGGPVSPDRFAMTNLNVGNGGQSPFTIEALVAPTRIDGAQQEIVCTDSYAGANRGFQFRIVGSQLQLQMLDGATFFNSSAPIPTTGPHGFTNGFWYHVAITYDGSSVKLYWTRLDPSVNAANQISSENRVITTGHGNVLAPLVFGNDNRGASSEMFSGSIDELRISNVARGPGQMQFFSPAVTIVANPISQNIDYTETVRFSVVAASPTPMGFQWRFDGNPISGANSNVYVISQVGAANAGLYDVVVTNSAGFASTSAPANLVVGAANFLAHRYSFNGNLNDSVGTAHGTNFGNATVVDGALVLDGTDSTYAQLPGGLLAGLNSATVDFWATIGTTPTSSRIFDFGNSLPDFTSAIVGFNYLFFTPNSGGAHRLTISSGDVSFEQNAAGTGTLENQTVHVTCVVDPPNQRMLLYTNGVLETINTNMTAPLSSLNNVLTYLGRSLYAVDPYLNGSIDEFRIYNGALSPITVQQNHEQGPNIVLSDGPVDFVVNPVSTNIPVGQTATFTATAVGYLPIRYQWYKGGVLVPGATNASYSLVSQLADNGTSIQVFATNVIGSTVYSDASTVATLNTFVPPTLVWLGASHGDWDMASLNWTNLAGGALTAYTSFASALFDARGSAAPTVNVTQPVNPDLLTVNSGSDYLITSFALNGSLVGQGRLVKQGAGRLTIDVTNNMSGGILISAGTLQIGNGTGTGTLGGGAVTNNSVLAFNRGDTLAVPNAITGSGSVRQDGSGAAALSGNNTYTGQTLVNSGVMFVQSSNALGATSAGTVVAAGAQVYITANVNLSGEALTISGSGADSSGSLRKGGAGATTLGGPIALAADATVGVDGGAVLTVSNSVSGAAILTKNGDGTLALSGPGSYTGGTLLTAGALQLNSNNSIGRGSVTAEGNGRVILGNGVTLTNSVVFNGVNPGAALGAIMLPDGSNAIATVSGPLTFHANAATGGHFAGPTNGLLNVTGPLSFESGANVLMVRLGNVRLSAPGIGYTELQIRANTTSIGANNAIAPGTVVDIAGNGTATDPTSLDLNGFNQTVLGLRNEVAPANLAWVTNSAGSLSTLTIDPQGGAYLFSGSIVGNLSLVLASGSQTFLTNGSALSGLHTYTGNTLINGGTLSLGTGVRLTGTPVIHVANGASLDVTAAGLVIGPGQTLRGGDGAFIVNGSVTNNGTIELDVNKAGATLSSDSIQGLNHIRFGGTLKLNVTASPALTASDSFKLFNAAGYSGTFASFVPFRPAPGLSWDQSTLAVDGILRIAVGGGPDTTPTNMVTAVTGGGTQLELAWPASHVGWRLQAQTNSLATGLNASWVDVSSSTATNRIIVPISKTSGAVFYRLVYP
ncbi:MAG TPA: LamG-like jellyroll fold domain-containing protein [Verrucomicrobiae bacterium]|nr:LamG-like jellyroll fold domain-containing protein [Verrucomicrobiae bacterium]